MTQQNNSLHISGLSFSPELFDVISKYQRIFPSNPSALYTREFADVVIQEMVDSLDIFNVSFIAHNVDRFMSTVLCQMNQSYTQQSQRYVKASTETVLNDVIEGFENILGTELYNQYLDFQANKVIPYYKKVSEVKEGEKEGGRGLDKYKYGIPIEDARYVLPMSVNTTVDITMGFDKLFDIYALGRIEYSMGWELGFHNLWKCLLEAFDNKFKTFFDITIMNRYFVERLISPSRISKLLRLYSHSESVLGRDNRQNDVMISSVFGDVYGVDKLVTGAYTSTQEYVDYTHIKNHMTDEGKRAIINRVTGYGHTSIQEHYQGLSRMNMSLSCYHQYLRHRIPTNRVNWILFDKYKSIHKNVFIPASILNGPQEFYHEYIEIMAKYREFYSIVMERCKTQSIPENKAIMLATRIAPNAAKVEVYSRSNLRADTWINRERLCMTAASEIRQLIAQKYLALTKDDEESLYLDTLPPCFLGLGCKEGKMTCSHAKAIATEVSEFKRNYAVLDNRQAEFKHNFYRHMVRKYSLNNGHDELGQVE